MTHYIILIGKSSIAVMVFFLFYRFILVRDNLFKRNRFFLLGGIMLSFILPWVRIPLIKAADESLPFSFNYIAGSNEKEHQITGGIETQSMTWLQILMVIYLIGALFFIIKTTFAYFQVFKIITKAIHVPLGQLRMAITPKKVSPFSLLHWLVISDGTQQHPSFEKMVQHEMVHSRQYHSLDLFIAEILILLQWFNPFAWQLRKCLTENLEFLVDREMLIKGTDAKEYQYSLLHFSMAGLKPAVVNNFNTNLLKKRIAMMNTSKFSKNYRFNNMMIPVCIAVVMLITASFQKDVKAEGMLNTQKSKALLPSKLGIDQSNRKDSPEKPKNNTKNTSSLTESELQEQVLGYFMKNTTYPQEALNMNQEGLVYLPMKFTANGAEMPAPQEGNSIISGETLKQVVVVAYANEETRKHAPADPNAETAKLLQNEVLRVIKSYTKVPEGLVGKTYIIPVKFIIDEIKVVEYANKQAAELNRDVKILIRRTDLSPKGNVTYILNNEKIISKEEMGAIDPNSIESINILKAEKVEHAKLGILNGDVIIINLKK